MSKVVVSSPVPLWGAGFFIGVCGVLGVFWVGEYGSGMSISSFPLAGRTVAVTAVLAAGEFIGGKGV